MRQETEQELAYTLLVELLAYQFASPVRWIETQDVILANKMTERVVEIGPADTLCTMAKRTLALKYEAYDNARPIQRQFLCSSKDAKEIYYDFDSDQDEAAQGTNPRNTLPPPAAVHSSFAHHTISSEGSFPRVSTPGGTKGVVAQTKGMGLDVPDVDAATSDNMILNTDMIDSLTKDHRVLIKQHLEVLARYLQMDLNEGDRAYHQSWGHSQTLKEQLDVWRMEHGDIYAAYIEPIFTPLKARVFDSSWNWVRQDFLAMYYNIVSGHQSDMDQEMGKYIIRTRNRASLSLLAFMQHRIDSCPTEKGENYRLAKNLGQELINNSKAVLGIAPVYKDTYSPTRPHTSIDAHGNLSYAEVPRIDIRNLEEYVRYVENNGTNSQLNSMSKIQSEITEIYVSNRQQHKLTKSFDVRMETLYTDIMQSLSDSEIELSIRKVRIHPGKTRPVEGIPLVHLKRKSEQGWEYSKRLTGLYISSLEDASKNGTTFVGKTALLTGANTGSISIELLKGFISGGGNVVVTTSQYSREVMEQYQDIYVHSGSNGSQLIVVPFNQGSKQDVEALIDFIYDCKKGLGWDLDYIIPFEAISEDGHDIGSIDSNSEIAHRIMLTNLLRLIGAVKTQKARRGNKTRPAQVILPLSPNHGTLGNNGLQSESTIALETLFNRWYSESWGDFLTICGAVIGWTRGTSLMSDDNDIMAEGLEAYGVRTFSRSEMAFNLLGLMSRSIVDICQDEPVFAYFDGGLLSVPNLHNVIKDIRTSIMDTVEVRQAVNQETGIERKIIYGEESEVVESKVNIEPRANMKFDFPRLPDWKTEIKPLNGDLKDMHDLERVVVLTGFAELGPWGNSRTRWEMEAFGKFSLEGCVEMAWIMGLIKNYNGIINGQQYAGWVDAKTLEPVDDKDVKIKYEKYILEHSGIRFIEPEWFDGYDPNRKQLLQEVALEQDLEPFEASREDAIAFKLEQGEKVDIFELENGQFTVILRKGATLLIPKALKFDRLVAGQIPKGWDAKKFGIADDIISQVDPVTLYVLVCTAEALMSSGITDPYEFYKYVHISEVGNCVGSGIGGVTALRGMYKDRFLDKPVQKDILGEAFVNTMTAWVNMLLMSSAGPIKTPSGACATAIESIDIGYDTIIEGKARICFVGGFDEIQEESSYEFANMAATSNAVDEIAHGRTAGEMSRPATTTRNGFMESHGAGIQVMMTARLALDMGVPIYGVIAMSATSTDKIGRSIPAPGKGILTTARENRSKFDSPMLNIKYRRRQIEIHKRDIKEWQDSELAQLSEELSSMKNQDEDFDATEYGQERASHIRLEANKRERKVLHDMGSNFWKKDTTIAPIRGALAAWGLTIDDIDVASLHGTSTVANDQNESETLSEQMQHLGRKKGNALMAVFQKFLTGHPKGAAGSWMMNGALQMLNSGLVPGNRNADNIDESLKELDYLVFPNKSIQTDGIKAVSVTSFGFGQKGAQCISIHPKYLFATLDQTTYNDYATKVQARHKKTYRYFHDGLINNKLFQGKSQAPYEDEQMSDVFLNPDARVSWDAQAGKFTYPPDFAAHTTNAVGK